MDNADNDDDDDGCDVNPIISDLMDDIFFIRKATILDAGASVLNISKASSRWVLIIVWILVLFLMSMSYDDSSPPSAVEFVDPSLEFMIIFSVYLVAESVV